MKAIQKKTSSRTRKINYFKKAISVICTLALLLTMTPVQVFATDEYGNPSAIPENSNTESLTEEELLELIALAKDTEEAPYIVGEAIDLREITIKHFRNIDGSYTAADYQIPIHFEDDEGILVDFDNTLVETSRGLEATRSSFDFVLPKDMTDGSGVFLSDGAHPITWIYDMVPLRDEVNAADAHAGDMGNTSEGALSGSADALDIDSNNADADDDADADADSTDGTNQASTSGSTSGSTPGSTPATTPVTAPQITSTPEVRSITPTKTDKEMPALEGNDRFIALSKLTDEVTYKDITKGVSLEYISSPVGLKENIVLDNRLADSTYTITYQIGNLTAKQQDAQTIILVNDAGKIIWTISAPQMIDAQNNVSFGLTLTILKEEKGTIKVELTADRKWLEDSERIYPVRIDPIITSELYIQNITQGFTHTQYWGWYTTFSNGSMYVGHEGYYGICHMYTKIALPALPASSTIISAKIGLVQYAYQVSPAVPANVTAHQILSDWNASTISPFAEPSRGEVLDYQTITSKNYVDRVLWDITKAAYRWYQGTSPNYGIVFKAADESVLWRAQFYSSNYPYIPTSYYPVLSIEYRNTIGLEPAWTAHTQSLGRSGVGYIKDFNQTLTWVHQDIAFDAGVNSIYLSHIYNSNSRATYPTSSNPGLYAGRVGQNWNLSMVQRLTPNLGGDQLFRDRWPWIYIDGDGTEHYIFGTHSSVPADLHNKDEDGLGLTYSFVGADIHNEYHRLTTKDGTKLNFDTWGNLRSVVDTNGNTTALNYSPCANNKSGGGDNYLSSIVTAAGTVTLNWANYTEGSATLKRLTSITDTAGRATTYTYTGDNLTKITYADGTFTQFVYASGTSKLTQVIGVDNSKINYTAGTTANYTAAREVATDGTLGQGYTIAQTGYLQVTYTDILKPTNKETYQFNTHGNTTGAYNPDGMAISQKFTNTPGWANNSLIGTASSGKTQINYIVNPVFGISTYQFGLYNYPGWTFVGGSTNAYVSSTVLFEGARSLEIKVSSKITSTTCVAAQDNLPLPSGKTYTISGYFKTTNVKGMNAGIAVTLSNGSTTYSKLLTGTTNPSLNDGWEYLNHTFVLPAGVSVTRVGFGAVSSTGSGGGGNGGGNTLSGTINASGFSLVEGEAPGNLNLFWDSGFERGQGNSSVAHTGTSSYSLPGNFGSSYKMYSLGVSGSAGDVYTFGGWAKAQCVPGADYSIALTFMYTDGTGKTHDCSFNKNIEDWQHILDVARAEKPYSDIRIWLHYMNSANTAYFDDVFIYRDNAYAYTYDNQGKLTSAESAAAAASTFEYNGNHISKIINPNGSGYEYHRDANKNITRADSAEGITYRINYDAKGNPISSEVFAASQMTSAISADKTYFIRNLNSGLYMDVQGGQSTAGTPVTQYGFNGTLAQQFTLVDAGDGYFSIIPSVAPSMRLDITANSPAYGAVLQIFSANATDAQKFKIIPNEGGGYRITTKSSANASVLTILAGSIVWGEIVKQCIWGNGADQSWYFEEVKTPRSDVPIDGDIFTIRASHSGKYLDVLGANPASGTELIQYVYNGTLCQRFRLIDAGGGYFKLAPLHAPGKVLTEQNSTYSGSQTYILTIEPDTSATNQQFKFNINPNGTYWIESKLRPGYGFDVVNASHSTLAKVGIFTYLGSTCQEFILEKCTESIKTSATYDTTGSFLTDVTDTRGNTTSFAYTTNKGLLSSVTNAKGTTTSYTYNTNNDRLMSVSSSGATVSYTYTTSGALSSIIHNGFTYSFSYNSFGRLTSVSVAGRTLISHTYGPNNGNLLTSTYGNGSTIAYAYDNYDRLISKTYNGTTTSTITYDAKGNIYKTYDGFTGITTTFTYDLIGRPLVAESSNGLKIWTEYDDKNRVQNSYISFDGGATSKKTTILYGTGTSGQNKSMIYGLSINNIQKVKYEYDPLCRLTQSSVGTSLNYKTTYRYVENPDKTTTTLLAGIKNGSAAEITYTYDNTGNITQIKEGATLKKSYEYDALGQLIRENDADANKTYTYTYDNAGNILTKSTYAYTTGTLGTVQQCTVYGYDATFKDLLVSTKTYSGDPATAPLTSQKVFVTDTIGNPTTYGGMTLTWQMGRRLATISGSGVSVSYSYNDAGIRTSKTVGGVTTSYVLSGTSILKQTKGAEVIEFFYDTKGEAFGFTLNGTEYWYVRNGQRDIIGIVNNAGTVVVSYTYDAWGNPIATTGSLAATVGAANPLRYRGYYYDVETGWYYLNSRYYDPAIGRFINADVYVSTGQGVLGTNMFAYCLNNPANRSDSNGNKSIKCVVKELFEEEKAPTENTAFVDPPYEPDYQTDGNTGFTVFINGSYIDIGYYYYNGVLYFQLNNEKYFDVLFSFNHRDWLFLGCAVYIYANVNDPMAYSGRTPFGITSEFIDHYYAYRGLKDILPEGLLEHLRYSDVGGSFDDFDSRLWETSRAPLFPFLLGATGIL